ncbi:UNKNOWN [Stylonychia lemnae]|uniref:Uncharacterized protein n=1 Tax=Stylonychia lemnae TaxID=5949 RepID=A0A078AP62_STYLE|nr:UNKNOWN [Stylonychia lemnae]|eukprot:CDW82753.1 UNKNOWN [Stylonychia lemnae]
MKRLFRPLLDQLHKTYEKSTFYKAPRSRSKIQRSYKQIDITKEFEIKHKRRENEKVKKLEELYQSYDQKALEMRDIVSKQVQTTPQGNLSDQSQASEVTQLAQQEAYDKIIKSCVLTVIKYHQIKHNLFEEVNVHPEILKNLEILHYHTENNLPIEKEVIPIIFIIQLVFMLVPELFAHEINKLDVADRERFKKPQLSYTRADGEQLEVDLKFRELRQNDKEKLFSKSMQMEMYMFEQTSDVYKLYYDQLCDEIYQGGHASLFDYLILLEAMDEENRKDWEKRLLSEIQELRLINEDVKALREHIAEAENPIEIPEFIMDPQIRAEAEQLLKFANKYETFDIRDTALIPIPKYRPDFDERLRESMDVEAMIEESLPARNLSEKDQDLLSKVTMIAQAVKVDAPPVIGHDINEEYIIEEQFRKELPSDKRILVDEVYKILYFNNQDPEIVQLFKLMQIVQHTILKTKRVIDMMSFIDTELQMKKRILLDDLTRDSYAKFLENDFSRRVVEEYGDEIGLFGNAVEYLGAEGEKIQLDNYLNAKVEQIIGDQKIIQDVDKQIKLITDGQQNDFSKSKNLKPIN